MAAKKFSVNPAYAWFVIANTPRGPAIASGWEFKSDAQDDLRDNSSLYSGGKVVAKSRLIDYGLAAGEERSWSNYAELKAGSASKGFLRGALGGLGSSTAAHGMEAGNFVRRAAAELARLQKARKPRAEDRIVESLHVATLLGAAAAHATAAGAAHEHSAAILAGLESLRDAVREWLEDV